MRCFCTYFDRNYLARGLALYRSLREHCPEFTLWVLCMDDATHESLTRLDLPGVEPIALKDFEEGDAALLAAKSNRTRVEYYFTCTPSLLLYVLGHWPAVDLLTYLDADLFFFAGPEPLFEELGAGSIAIIGHRFAPHLISREQFGIYNVGWLTFRRDDQALACLDWWRSKCIEWCYDRPENGRFADQKYLDDWPGRFRQVVVLQHRGANLALWNLGNHRLRSPNGKQVLVDDAPLIFFHFHGLTKITGWLFDPDWTAYGVTPSAVLRGNIYLPYLRTLCDAGRLFPRSSGVIPPAGAGVVRRRQEGKRVSLPRRALRTVRDLLAAAKDIMTGKYIFLFRPCRKAR
ncbi:MAG: hypothetical protein ACYC9Y_07045 [Candidatus Methylomirabilia bacterium]